VVRAALIALRNERQGINLPLAVVAELALEPAAIINDLD
jgi:hypothetical protein